MKSVRVKGVAEAMRSGWSVSSSRGRKGRRKTTKKFPDGMVHGLPGPNFYHYPFVVNSDREAQIDQIVEYEAKAKLQNKAGSWTWFPYTLDHEGSLIVIEILEENEQLETIPVSTANFSAIDAIDHLPHSAFVRACPSTGGVTYGLADKSSVIYSAYSGVLDYEGISQNLRTMLADAKSRGFIGACERVVFYGLSIEDAQSCSWVAGLVAGEEVYQSGIKCGRLPAFPTITKRIKVLNEVRLVFVSAILISVVLFGLFALLNHRLGEKESAVAERELNVRERQFEAESNAERRKLWLSLKSCVDQRADPFEIMNSISRVFAEMGVVMKRFQVESGVNGDRIRIDAEAMDLALAIRLKSTLEEEGDFSHILWKIPQPAWEGPSVLIKIDGILKDESF